MKKTNDGAVRWWSEDKGFYMVLLLCVAAVAAAAYVLFVSPGAVQTDPMDGYVYEADDSVTTSDSLDRVPAMDAETVTDETQTDSSESEQEAAQTAAADDAESEEKQSKTAETVAVLTFVPPMDAEVSRAFSGDTLEYDETTRDWRTHNGADYAGQKGAAVCAVADGTVTEIGEDAICGKYVTISHAQDMQSLYAGLDDITVREGDTVSGGKQIASLGDPMPLEQKQGVHLHLELRKEGTAVDPTKFF